MGGALSQTQATAPRTAADGRMGRGEVSVGGHAMRIPPFSTSRDNSWPGQWPLQSFLELGALPSAVPCARLHTRQILWEWHLTGLNDGAELLVSELVTNAVQISRADAQSSPVRLWLLADQARALILVWDASPVPPVRLETSGNAENGRGLLLVETISTQWDWYFPPQEQGGKVVWALLETP